MAITFPFQMSVEEINDHIDDCIDHVISGLTSHFLTIPKGTDFIEYDRFSAAYAILKEKTAKFSNLTVEDVIHAIHADPISFIVLRVILGFSPPELAYITSLNTDVKVTQGQARSIDRDARANRPVLGKDGSVRRKNILAMIEAAISTITEGTPEIPNEMIHRLDKIDTCLGLDSLKRMATNGAPYEAILYERMLGRPFASHRDAQSEIIGNILEDAIKKRLDAADLKYYETGKAEQFEDMDQGPDFFIPDKNNPIAVIEAKIAEDDGTARDKVTRIQHLYELSKKPEPGPYEVIACIDGRGFGVRREDVKKLIYATKGKVFTLKTLDYLIPNTSLKEQLNKLKS